jgi:hypothetical protein
MGFSGARQTKAPSPIDIGFSSFTYFGEVTTSAKNGYNRLLRGGFIVK